MKNVIIVLCLIGIGLIGIYINRYLEVISINQVLNQEPSSASKFQAYDATQFTDTHNWVGKPVNIIYEIELLNNSNNSKIAPDEKIVKKNLVKYYGVPRLLISIPSWRLITNGKLDPMASKYAKWYSDVLNWAKSSLPTTNLGFVGLPMSLYEVINNQKIDYYEYSKALALIKPVLMQSNSLYPSFDVRDDNIENINSVIANIVMIAKESNKPVFPFMWHKGTMGKYGYSILPDAILINQCKLLKYSTDGLVWWSDKLESWSGGAWYSAASNCFN